MILLLGGTSDTRPIAERLAERGFRVLVSQATTTPLMVGDQPAIETRSGPLDDRSLAALLHERGILAIVDATHPYATAIRARARRVAEKVGIRYLSFVRPPVILQDEPDVEFAEDHRSAAAKAFAHGRPVLLTTGSNHLTAYAEESRRSGVQIWVRVLGNPESLAACRAAEIPETNIITGRGPFSVEENRRQIRAFGIGALVTKDSGQAGGTIEKLDAARAEGCRVVVVQRPGVCDTESFSDVATLIAQMSNVQ